MKQSQLFSKTLKNAPKDEVSTNAQLLIRAGFVDKQMGGVYSFLPLGLRVLNNISNIIREEMNAIGGQEMLMPVLGPKKVWQTTNRWDIDVLYKLQDKSGRDFGLAFTHEDVVTPLVQKHAKSYKDFPFAVYQIQDKFRMELRAKSGLFRGREFFMKDMYSFHLSETERDIYYETVREAYKKIFARLGIGERTYVTYASGGDFSKYSDEFQTLSAAGEDTIYICTGCNVAINKEIKDENATCPDCGSVEFREERSIEVGNIFKLGTKFSEPYHFMVQNESGEDVLVTMCSYGIGVNRMMGTIAELLHDENGLVWPENVAPFSVHLLSLGQDEEATKIYEQLRAQGVEVLFDDRDLRAGEKFSDADLMGMPLRIVVSKKSLAAGGVEVKKRTEKKSETMSVDSLLKFLSK